MAHRVGEEGKLSAIQTFSAIEEPLDVMHLRNLASEIEMEILYRFLDDIKLVN